MQRAELQQRLSRSAGSRHLPEAEVVRIASAARARKLAAGEPVFAEGDPGDAAFLVLEGSVEIRKEIGDGEWAPIALRGALEWIGEMAVLDGGPRSASAVADGPARLLEIPGALFAEVLGAHPEAMLDLLRFVSARLRGSDAGLVDALRKQTRALAVANEQLRTENHSLRAPLEAEGTAPAFRGKSAAARRVRAAAERAARSELPVLLVGEAGTGKHRLARAIHAASERAARPFVAIDCAGLGETLLESELFGYAPGALAGAHAQQRGLLAIADGGTLLLSSIEAMPKAVQGLLFRVLETGTYRPMGERELRPARVRVVAASRTGFDAAVGDGAFRSDLRERIAATTIEVPPLRERRADLDAIVAGLLDEIETRPGRTAFHLGADAREVLALHPFPGNVAELDHELDRLAMCVEPGATVGARDLAPSFLDGAPPPSGHYSDAVRAFKIRLVRNTLAQTRGDRAQAARHLGLHRSNLNRILRDLGLDEGR